MPLPLEQVFPQFDPELIAHLEKIGQVAEFDNRTKPGRPVLFFKSN
jgi:hypothetical protein